MVQGNDMACGHERSPVGSGTFDAEARGEIRELIAQYPLAWVSAEGGREACLLPLIGIFDEADNLTELIGHFGRSNPLHAALLRDPQATLLFTGPQGYISPSQAGRRDWGPTWNYAQVHVRAEISVEPELTPDAVEMLTGHVEGGRDEPWRQAELGERYDQLIRHIIGFRARVVAVKSRFKLGQDERLDDLQAILSNLPDGELKQWMQRCNRRRLEAK